MTLPNAVSGKGAAFAMLAVTIFAAQDGLSKYLATEYPPVFVVMIRYWAFALFAVAAAMRAKGGIAAVARTGRPGLQIFRGAFLAMQVVIAITSFSVVGLVGTHAIFASAPLLVAVLSMPVLGERVGWRRWLAICVGFGGVLLILQPGGGRFDVTLLLPVVAAVGIAVYGVLTRLVSRTDSSATSFFYTGVAGAAAITLIGPFYWVSVAPGDLPWLLLLCITGSLGHYYLIRAFELLDAVVVQPFSYVQMVLASMIGIAVFGEALTTTTAVGAFVVVAAGAFTVWRESVAARRVARRLR